MLNYTISKLDPYVGDLVKEEITRMNDQLVMDLVYGKIPMISQKVIILTFTFFRKPTLM